MRKRAIVFFAILVLTAVVLPGRGSALPLETSLFERNGLNWLSPIWSQHIAFTDILSHLSTPSSTYYGLRVATVTEVVDLLNSYPLAHPAFSEPFSIGAAIDDSRVFGPAYGAMDPIFNQFGWVELGTFPDYCRVLGGYSWDPVAERTMVTTISEHDIYGGLFSSDSYELAIATYGTSIMGERPWYGTWLIQPAPIPEPATALLLVAGLVGLGLYRKARKEVKKQ